MKFEVDKLFDVVMCATCHMCSFSKQSLCGELALTVVPEIVVSTRILKKESIFSRHILRTDVASQIYARAEYGLLLQK